MNAEDPRSTPAAPAEPQAEGTDALIAALMDIERHVSAQGWDQPARLFALVRTDELIRNEPSLAAHLAVGNEDALSSIEQEDFHAGENPLETLARIQWPASVAGCAIALERTFLPSQYEADLPRDDQAAAAAVANHPHKQDIRVVVGALRDGSRHGVARLVSNPEHLLGATDLVPNLTEAVAGTLR